MLKDIEIAQKTNLNDIVEVATDVGISRDNIIQYGKYKAKIEHSLLKELETVENGKLILVTSINPTPLGEGKTTTSIGLADGLRIINKRAVLALREPSLGPVFGIKGGATGGGYSQVAPMEDINLHFTGDIHAITTANNLLSAIVDNHIFQGNKLEIDVVTWKRCMDMNDRQLRYINCGLGGKKDGIERKDGFDISVASEIMAIFCLAQDLKDLKLKLGNIVVGYNKDAEPITARDLKADGAMTVLLKDAFNPNLVQTLEYTPAIIHGGPFANIAHGCNSVIATKLALKLGDYVVTEAGFGADLGAEKFLDIKCRLANLKPDVVVCVATIKALKYHGGILKEDLGKENIEGLSHGIKNLLKHIENLTQKFNQKVVVAINKYDTDTKSEIDFLTQKCKEYNVNVVLSEVWAKGGEGGIDLANEVVKLAENSNELTYMYDLSDSIKEKIEKVSKKVYGATGVDFSEKALEQIKNIEKIGYSNLPICIAKTQYSLSDNPLLLEINEEFNINVREVVLKAGAGFIVIITGNVMTMPGLPKIPSAESITIDNNGKILGLF